MYAHPKLCVGHYVVKMKTIRFDFAYTSSQSPIPKRYQCSRATPCNYATLNAKNLRNQYLQHIFLQLINELLLSSKNMSLKTCQFSEALFTDVSVCCPCVQNTTNTLVFT